MDGGGNEFNCFQCRLPLPSTATAMGINVSWRWKINSKAAKNDNCCFPLLRSRSYYYKWHKQGQRWWAFSGSKCHQEIATDHILRWHLQEEGICILNHDIATTLPVASCYAKRNLATGKDSITGERDDGSDNRAFSVRLNGKMEMSPQKHTF